MIHHVSADVIRGMTAEEGLVLQGCGGPPQEWLDSINQLLTSEGILRNGDTFQDIYIFPHNGLTNILFPMENVTLDVGKLALWRIMSYSAFHGTWLSDYLPNRLNVFEPEQNADELEME